MSRCDFREAISAVVLVLAAGSLLTAAEDNIPTLRYGFQTGKQYAFEVRIQAELENLDIVREGVMTFTVTTPHEGQLVLKPSGNLPVQMKPHPNRNGFSREFCPPWIYAEHFFSYPMGPGIPGESCINLRGEKVVARQLTSIPYLLGEMESWMIEELPVEAKSNWETQREVDLVERRPDVNPNAQHAFANEQIIYALQRREKDILEISKKYALRSFSEGDKAGRFEMSGEGRFTFDSAEGVIRSLSMRYDFQMNEKNVTLKFPFTFSYRLLSPEELAERQKKAEEERKTAEEAAAKANLPKAFDPGERERLLKDLRSLDPNRLRVAAERLTRAPVDIQPADFAEALAPLLDYPEESVQVAAARALVVWAAPEAEDSLVNASHLENACIRSSAIEALGKLKSPRAAEAVAAQLFRNRGEVPKALKTMGMIAESATIKCLKDRDQAVRFEACAILSEIGGKKSLEALDNYAKALPGEAPSAYNAISAIERRLELQKGVHAE
jgi:hypothetical protein